MTHYDPEHALALCARHRLDPERIPAHVAVVMDGNGRWAQKRGLERTQGHAAGEVALFDTVNGAVEIGLRWLTVYAFSTENWNRPPEEVEFLMWFNRDIMRRRRVDLDEMGVRVRVLGRRGRPIPADVIRSIEETESLTARNRAMTLIFCFNYGGRAEIADAVRRVGAEVAAGELDPRRVTEATIARRLYAPDMPDPDILIRTSGEVRTSNFLLWEAAYSELVFTKTLWPDFRRRHLYAAIRRYQGRERRFGAV